MSIPATIISSVVLYGKRDGFNSFTLVNIFISLISLIAFNISFIYLDRDAGFKYELVTLIINGFFMQAIWGYAMEYAVELAPNVPEEMSSGIIGGLVAVFAFV